MDLTHKFNYSCLRLVIEFVQIAFGWLTVVGPPAWKCDPGVSRSSLAVPSTNLGSRKPIVTVFRGFWNIDGVWLSGCKMSHDSLLTLFVPCWPLFPLECVFGLSYHLMCFQPGIEYLLCSAIYGRCAFVVAS